MFGMKWKRAYDGLVVQFQREQNQYFVLLSQIEDFYNNDACKKCKKKVKPIVDNAL